MIAIRNTAILQYWSTSDQTALCQRRPCKERWQLAMESNRAAIEGVQCAVCREYFTVYSVVLYSAVYTVQCIVFSIQCSVCSVQSAVFTLQLDQPRDQGSEHYHIPSPTISKKSAWTKISNLNSSERRWPPTFSRGVKGNKELSIKEELLIHTTKIPHTGDTESLDRCGS